MVSLEGSILWSAKTTTKIRTSNLLAAAVESSAAALVAAGSISLNQTESHAFLGCF